MNSNSNSISITTTISTVRQQRLRPLPPTLPSFRRPPPRPPPLQVFRSRATPPPATPHHAPRRQFLAMMTSFRTQGRRKGRCPPRRPPAPTFTTNRLLFALRWTFSAASPVATACGAARRVKAEGARRRSRRRRRQPKTMALKGVRWRRWRRSALARRPLKWRWRRRPSSGRSCHQASLRPFRSTFNVSDHHFLFAFNEFSRGTINPCTSAVADAGDNVSTVQCTPSQSSFACFAN